MARTIGARAVAGGNTVEVMGRDQSKAADLANQVDKKLWDQMATLPLYQKPTFIAYQSSVQGVEDNASQAGPLWNSEVWSQKQ